MYAGMYVVLVACALLCPVRRPVLRNPQIAPMTTANSSEQGTSRPCNLPRKPDGVYEIRSGLPVNSIQEIHPYAHTYVPLRTSLVLQDNRQRCAPPCASCKAGVVIPACSSSASLRGPAWLCRYNKKHNARFQGIRNAEARRIPATAWPRGRKYPRTLRFWPSHRGNVIPARRHRA